MSADQRLLLAFLVAVAGTALLTPVAIWLARRTGFLDHPKGYKGHDRPTPYLGGLAVGGGIALSAILFGGAAMEFSPIALCAVALWLVGTVDDRIGLNPATRVFVAVAVGVVIWGTGLGWSGLGGGEALSLMFTVLWVVGLINAYNLMDNMDGAAASVGCVSAAGVAVIGMAAGRPMIAAFALAVSGACAAFLCFNLTSPARIFLGDGGSMPLGFLIAATAMSVPLGGELGILTVFALAPVAGLPILDVCLVVISRRRRSLTLLSGGRDHITHRLRRRLGSPRSVALLLTGVQVCLCGLAFALTQMPPVALALASAAYVAAGLMALRVLERPAFAPDWFPVVMDSEPEAPAAQGHEQPILIRAAHKQSA